MFDILGLCFMDKGLLCGGSSSDFDDRMEKFFVRLTQNGVKLVFIQDLAIEIAREDLWIERRNNDFQVYLEIYEKIEMKKPAMDIVSEMSRSRTGWKSSPNAASIASKHGEYRFARFGRDCDFEVADYATKHNAMAVFSADSDFLIFEGNWKFWNFNNLNFENFTAIEYDRLTISRLLAITFQQRPLFATLIGNDFSKQCQDELNQFHRRLGSPHDKFRNVANFIRREFRRIDLSEDDIDFIVTEVFGSHAGDDKWQLIQDSLNSYDLHSQIDENPENDPIETRLISFGVKPIKNYRKMNINSIQMVSISFNDMATVECSTVLVGFLVDLIRKRIAIINNNVATNGEKTFKILKKMSREEKFAAYHESPIAPDCKLATNKMRCLKNLDKTNIILCTFIGPMPDLIELLTNDDSNEELNEIRWTLLAWMLSISDEHRDVLRSMDREFRVSCATLLALVQVNIHLK